MPTLLGRVGMTVADTMSDLAAPGPGERLARRSSSNQLDLGLLDELPGPLDLIRVAKVPADSEPTKVVSVRLSRLAVRIDPHHYAIASRFKSKAQPTRTAEQVRCQAVTLVPQLLRVGEESFLPVLLRVRLQLYEWASNKFDSVCSAFALLRYVLSHVFLPFLPSHDRLTTTTDIPCALVV